MATNGSAKNEVSSDEEINNEDINDIIKTRSQSLDEPEKHDTASDIDTDSDVRQQGDVQEDSTAAGDHVIGEGDTGQKNESSDEASVSKLRKRCQAQEEEIKRLKADNINGVRSAKEQLELAHNKLSHSQQEVDSLRKELETSQQKLTSHDSAAKKAVSALQAELKTKQDQAQKQIQAAQREKEDMVMKYALAEGKNLEEQKKAEKAELRVREMNKEKEMIIMKFKNLKAEYTKTRDQLEARNADVAAAKREIERMREGLGGLDARLKSTGNKLKAEQELLAESRAREDDLQGQLNRAKEETEQIRKDCQAMIKTYQESEDIKSNQLDARLKEKESELILHQYEKTDQAEMQQSLRNELEALKTRHKEALAEVVLCREKEEELERAKTTVANQKRENKDLLDRLCRLENVEQDLTLEKLESEKLRDQLAVLQESNSDLHSDIEGCAKRESEHLIFTQKLSDKNAKLQSENTNLSKQLTTVTSELDDIRSSCVSLEERLLKSETSLSTERSERQSELERLTKALDDKTKAVTSLTRELDDERDDVKTLKRRHQASLKDLTRQLAQAKKKLEAFEKQTDGTSMGSRTSSNTSLDTVGHPAGGQGHMTASQGQGHLPASNNASSPTSKHPETPTLLSPQDDLLEPQVKVVEVDRQLLIDKIVKLQRSSARKTEKLDFQQDHIQQLLEEIRKKTKIIQSYALREESGALAPEVSDENKAQFARRTGVMASVYSAHSDGHVTLDLSLDINRKLQAVLEDTLLKNITLKDNLETLGGEIARISQENRQLQLTLQGHAGQ